MHIYTARAWRGMLYSLSHVLWDLVTGPLNLIAHDTQNAIDYLVWNMINRPIMRRVFIMRYNKLQ